jgi:hypothetical protein
MSSTVLMIVLAGAVFVWLLVCILIYNAYRTSSLLAAPTVSSCLFLLGATVAASVLVPGAFYLLPVWVGVLVLSLLHLHQTQTRRNRPAMESLNRHRVNPTTPESFVQEENSYI